MAGPAHYAVLVLVALACAAGATAQGGNNLTDSLGDVSCLASSENRNAGLAIARSCGDLASAVRLNGASVDINCPDECGAAFNQLTVACRNDLTSNAALGSTYRLIFSGCDVDFSGSSSGNSTTPTAAANDVNITAFECLVDRRNRDAGNRFARFCSGDALQPRPGNSTDLGFTLTCSANCAAALGDVTEDCINEIADSESFGGIYQEIFRACNISDKSDSMTPTTAPTAAATGAPTAAPTDGDTDEPTAAPTSGGTASTPTAAPTAAPTPAPQSAPRTAGSLATFGAAAAAATTLLALLA